jgi:hypothetical protein
MIVWYCVFSVHTGVSGTLASWETSWSTNGAKIYMKKHFCIVCNKIEGFGYGDDRKKVCA